MRKTFLLIAFLFAGAMTAHASVIYSFQACCGGIAQFQYTAPAFLSSPVSTAINIPVASLDSCSSSFPCTSIDFFPSGRSADDAAVHPEFILNTSFGSLKEFFPFGSFGAAGVYLGAAGTPLNTPSDTLRVTVGGTVTPEPTTVSLLAIIAHPPEKVKSFKHTQ